MQYLALILIHVCWFWFDPPPVPPKEKNVWGDSISVGLEKAYAVQCADHDAKKSLRTQCEKRGQELKDVDTEGPFCSSTTTDDVERWTCLVSASGNCYTPDPPPVEDEDEQK